MRFWLVSQCNHGERAQSNRSQRAAVRVAPAKPSEAMLWAAGALRFERLMASLHALAVDGAESVPHPVIGDDGARGIGVAA